MRRKLEQNRLDESNAAVPHRHDKAIKARQCAKIHEIGEALRAAGFVSLDQQATVLGIGRSTAWSLLRASHKNSGLSATIISRMLAHPGLPPQVRTKVVEYVAEKSAGIYGHNERQRRKFSARLSSSFSYWRESQLSSNSR
jgi:hypothetical protein